MSAWPVAALRHVARLEYGSALPAPERIEGEFPVVGSGGADSTHVRANSGPGPTIVVGRKGSAGSVRWFDSPAHVIDTAYWVKAGERIDYRFLYYALLTQDWAATTQDVGVPGLSRETAHGTQVPVPPLDEQRRIADFLDAEIDRLDRLVLARQSQLSLLPARWRSVLDGVYATLAERNGVAPLGRHLVRIEQGTSPQCYNVEADSDEWGVLKAGAVKGDRFVPTENKRLPDDIAAEERYEIRAGDLLITRANTPALVGAAAVVPDGVRTKLILCDKIFRLQLSPSLLPDYVSLLSQASVIRDARAANATGASSSMVNLTNHDVKSWPLPLATLDDQKGIVGELMEARERQYSLGRAIAAQLALVHERRQALITAAVTGQIDVTTAGSATP